MAKAKRPITIKGNTAEIVLANGDLVTIDAEDAHKVAPYNWTLSHGSEKNSYVITYDFTRGRKTIYLHRLLMGTKDDLKVAHLDGNRLNNRRSNLSFTYKTKAMVEGRKNAKEVYSPEVWKPKYCSE